MPKPNDSSLLELLDSAETPGDVLAVQQLWEEQLAAEKSRDKWLLESLTEVAGFFGLDEQTIRTWRLKTPPMPGEAGRWPIKEIVKWRCDWIQQSDLAAAKRQQDYDLGQILVEQRRLELDREKGLILDRADVELWASTALVELREGIMRLPEILASTSPQDLRDFVREETDRHCRDLLTATTRRLELAEIGKDGHQSE